VIRPRRTLALLIAVATIAGMPATASAADPVTADEAAASAPQTSVHADMLAEHADDSVDFAPGAEPAVALQSIPASGEAEISVVADGGTTALPNGLRREVFGYLPYWYLTPERLDALDYGLVSTIAYFGVGARSDGTLARTAQGNTTPTWGGWISSDMTTVTNRAHAMGVKVVLTVTMMAWNGDYAEMSALLTSSTNRQRLIGEIVATVKARGADGVNLDFEPVPSSLKSQYTSFVRALKTALVNGGGGRYLTVATMAGAATWTTGYDLVGLTAAGAADALMVMAYDFNWSGSARAGGVAPINSAYVFDASEALEDHLALVPGSKLIWGVPYYGRGWTTQSGSLNALTCRTASVCPSASASAIGRTWAPTYVDALAGVSSHGPRLWDAAGQVPWYRYVDSTRNAWTEVYYDDAASLGAKYSMVERNGLRGIGIWSLLMDAGRRDLYNQIDAYFQGIWFYDILGTQFFSDILWIAEQGITTGCAEERFCPNATVTRGQMAAFLVRAFDLPAASRDYFTDDESSIFEADINRLAASGIASGCGSGRFCPGGTITRGQMAAFLARAMHLPAASRDYFTDDNSSIFEADINRLAASGVASGCGSGRFCPTAAVTRGQMAAFLRRAVS
jgi:spore germination protein YaaH